MTAEGNSKKHARTISQENVLKHPSTKRAKEIDGPDNPYRHLLEHMSKTDPEGTEPKNVMHWFRSKDLRAEDNRSLHAASLKAKEGNGALITCFLFSPEDLEWHGTSPARCDFMLESLGLLKQQLAGLNIPLVLLTAEKRGDKGTMVLKLVKEQGVSHVYANIEYEVDELRRDLDFFERLEKEDEVQFVLHQDQTVVEPGTLKTGAGGPMKVYTPYHKAWLSEVSSNPELLDTMPAPQANDKSLKSELKELFDQSLPKVPDSKKFESKEEREGIRKMWPAGHEAGIKRLQGFLEKKVQTYAQNRSNPAADNSSRLSAYFSSGVISVREALSAAKKANEGSADFSQSGADAGISSWVRELVFREFYRHMMVVTPHNSMNLPQNLKFDFVEWEDDEEGWQKWCDGTTGVPFVDAGMRQLKNEAYMHNRLRMNVSSYLSRSLLIDYRRGERWFVEKLVDWDLCNNTQGWEPSYTVFNPVVQAEKCDPHGDYIRKWVPELKDVKGKAVFDPYHRLSEDEFRKLGYPKPHVDFKESKERCVQRYKQDMADADP
ncbi:putative Photolyase/cryptochrome alpha/beta domain-containing protein [Seiridium cardinale]